jgi:hypothetical protein
LTIGFSSVLSNETLNLAGMGVANGKLYTSASGTSIKSM